MDKIEKIRKLASIFRETIIRIRDKGSSNSFFSNFPNGCCGDASDLLSIYFYQNGIDVDNVSGRDKEMTHSWLEHDDIIIDITADQFDEIHEEVIVSNECHWHKRFANQNRYNSAGKFNYFGIQSNRLESLYNIILDEIFRPVTSKKP